MTLKTENRSLSQETRLNTPTEFLFARTQRLPNTNRSRAHGLLCKQVPQKRAGGDTTQPMRDAHPPLWSKQKQVYPTSRLGAHQGPGSRASPPLRSPNGEVPRILSNSRKLRTLFIGPRRSLTVPPHSGIRAHPPTPPHPQPHEPAAPGR